jgi:hypothetical protein
VPHVGQAEVGLVDKLQDFEAQYLGVEALTAIDIGHRQIDMRDTGQLGHPSIQSPTRFS